MQKHLRDQNVITSGSLAIASVRIGLKQNLPLNGSRVFSSRRRIPGPRRYADKVVNPTMLLR